MLDNRREVSYTKGMTNTSHPAPRTTDEIAADLAARSRRRAVGLTVQDPHAVSILREADRDRDNFGVVARTREDVRRAQRFHEREDVETKLTVREARRLGWLAMAALGHDETYVWSCGTRKVGPYVDDAVQYVLTDVEHTGADRHLVFRFAALANVVTRL